MITNGLKGEGVRQNVNARMHYQDKRILVERYVLQKVRTEVLTLHHRYVRLVVEKLKKIHVTSVYECNTSQA